MTRTPPKLTLACDYMVSRFALPRRPLVDFLDSSCAAINKAAGKADRNSAERIRRWSRIYSDERLKKLLRANCLNYSVAVFRSMMRSGLTPTLHLGVKRTQTGLTGHCWLTHDGRFLDERDRAMAEGYEEILKYAGTADLPPDSRIEAGPRAGKH